MSESRQINLYEGGDRAMIVELIDEWGEHYYLRVVEASPPYMNIKYYYQCDENDIDSVMETTRKMAMLYVGETGIADAETLLLEAIHGD